MPNQILPNYVFVLDTNKKPLAPCKPSVARRLLNCGKARVFKLYPFTIILNKQVDDDIKPLTLKLDPGSKTTGIALLDETKVIWCAKLTHRGFQIKSDLESRRNIRRSRRNRKTRYRKPRFLNRKKNKSWLAPSLMHRVLTTMTWVNRLKRLCSINLIYQELVKFDLQKLENPEISGIEYQQGTLHGYSVREYLLEKWGRQCTYCEKSDIPLQVEHIKARVNGGSNRISNLCLACEKCNLKKGVQDIKVFLKKKPELLRKILAQAKQPLRDATAVNATRWCLFNNLKSTGLEVKTGSGGQTKFNRIRFGLEKQHWIDAACVGDINSVTLLVNQPLLITCKGHGNRQMVTMDKYGFPRKGYKAKQKVKGWNTGDIVNVVDGKHKGLKCMRLRTVRYSGYFDIRLSTGKVIGVKNKDVKVVCRNDGYDYKFK